MLASNRSSGGQPPDPNWSARAQALSAVLARASDDIEKERRLPSYLLDALYDAELFRILLPRSFDGGEADPISFAEAIEIVAREDASAAWCLGQAAGCSFSAAFLDRAAAREIFANPRAVVAWGPGTHHSRAVATGEGYRVTGSWMYASGSRHATWLGAHCAVFEKDGSPRLNGKGRQVEKTMLFPKSAAHVEDVWQVIGLRGTGSDNYSLADHFIPDEFTYVRDSAEDRRESGTLYRLPLLSTYGIAFSSIALGVARSALEAFVQLAAEKKPRAGAGTLRDNAVIQAQVGVAEAKLQSCRAYLHRTLETLWDTLSRERELSLDLRVNFRLSTTFAIQQAKEVVDGVYASAGATAIFEKQPFERKFRDMHAVSQQIQGHAANFETAGRVLLGVGGPDPRL